MADVSFVESELEFTDEKSTLVGKQQVLALLPNSLTPYVPPFTYLVLLNLPGLTLIPAWISNHIHYKVWDEITYPFLNFNGCTVEV